MLYIVLLWWNDLTIHINNNVDEAVCRHNINKLCQNWEMLNIYMNSSDIKSQINTVTVILKRDLRCIIYIDIDETFIVYMTEL